MTLRTTLATVLLLLATLACGGWSQEPCPALSEVGGAEYTLEVVGGPPEAVAEVLRKRLAQAEVCGEVRIEGDRVLVGIVGDVTPEEVDFLVGESVELRIAAEVSEEQLPEAFADRAAPWPVSDHAVGGSEAAREAVEAMYDRLPPGLFAAVERREEPEPGWEPRFFEQEGALGGGHLVDAQVVMDSQLGTPTVQLEFDAEGAKLQHELTRRQVGERIGIILGGEVYSMPVVQEAISGGRAVISLGHRASVQEARSLAAVLRAGALPSPVRLESVRLIDPAPSAP